MDFYGINKYVLSFFSFVYFVYTMSKIRPGRLEKLNSDRAILQWILDQPNALEGMDASQKNFVKERMREDIKLLDDIIAGRRRDIYKAVTETQKKRTGIKGAFYGEKIPEEFIFDEDDALSKANMKERRQTMIPQDFSEQGSSKGKEEAKNPTAGPSNTGKLSLLGSKSDAPFVGASAKSQSANLSIDRSNNQFREKGDANLSSSVHGGTGIQNENAKTPQQALKEGLASRRASIAQDDNKTAESDAWTETDEDDSEVNMNLHPFSGSSKKLGMGGPPPIPATPSPDVLPPLSGHPQTPQVPPSANTQQTPNDVLHDRYDSMDTDDDVTSNVFSDYEEEENTSSGDPTVHSISSGTATDLGYALGTGTGTGTGTSAGGSAQGQAQAPALAPGPAGAAPPPLPPRPNMPVENILESDRKKRLELKRKRDDAMFKERATITPDDDPALVNMGQDPQAFTRRHEARRKLAVMDNMNKSDGTKQEAANVGKGANTKGWRFNGPYDYPTNNENPGSWQLEAMTAKSGPKVFAKGIRHESLWRSHNPKRKHDQYYRYKHAKGDWKKLTKPQVKSWHSKRSKGYGRRWESKMDKGSVGGKGMLNAELKEILSGWRAEVMQRQHGRSPLGSRDNPIIVEEAAKNPIHARTIKTEVKQEHQ